MMNWGSVNMKGKLTKKLGCKCCIAFNGKKLKKYSKVSEKLEIKRGISELGVHTLDLSNEPFYKSLFPKANKIEYYEDVCGDLVLEVDGKYFGYLEQWEEIMSFQYFTGCSFVDHEDVMKQYSEYLETNERGDWLP